MSISISLFRAFAWELRRTFRDLAAVADRGLQPLGITVGDRAILEMLARQPQPISLSELARRHSVSRQHIQQALRRLPNPSWIEVKQNPNDARAMTVLLSSSGHEFWKKIELQEEEFFNDIASNLSTDDIQNSISTLKLIRSNLEKKMDRQGDD